MAGSRAVQARVRLAKRLKEQQAALAATGRCQDAVDRARVRQAVLVAQGATLVGDAEKVLAASIVELVAVMGSAELAAAVLDIEEAVVRRAVAAKPAGATVRPHSVAPGVGKSARGGRVIGGGKGSGSVEDVRDS
jgi:hypothetical protein